jgi:AbrB family looped-hinge helix DNA binding protein
MKRYENWRIVPAAYGFGAPLYNQGRNTKNEQPHRTFDLRKIKCVKINLLLAPPLKNIYSTKYEKRKYSALEGANIMDIFMVDNAKVMSEGQVTIPKEICGSLKISEGDRVTFVCGGDYAIMMNANIYAMRTLQREMSGEWEKAGIFSEDDITLLCHETRAEVEGR